MMNESVKFLGSAGNCYFWRMVDTLENLGYKVSATDSANIAVFTNNPINKKSVKVGNFDLSYITSFGIVGALKFIEDNRKEV